MAGSPRPESLLGRHRALRDRPPAGAARSVQGVEARGEEERAVLDDLGLGLRLLTVNIAEVRPPEIVSQQDSVDGTRKWAIRVDGGVRVGRGAGGHRGDGLVGPHAHHPAALCILDLLLGYLHSFASPGAPNQQVPVP